MTLEEQQTAEEYAIIEYQATTSEENVLTEGIYQE